ncbi:hypothetical protein PENTCL1PPCAC_29461, partial [Pristionchus entomophagus]
ARFSRRCHGCGNPHPSDRVILTACGHAVCRTCADARATKAMECPDCAKRSSFLRLYEERVSVDNFPTQADGAPHFSRACGVCYAPNPAARGVVKTCGHVACLACIEQLKRGDRVKCPFCIENAPIVRLIEHLLSTVG